jgi:hypothetical protein
LIANFISNFWKTEFYKVIIFGILDAGNKLANRCLDEKRLGVSFRYLCKYLPGIKDVRLIWNGNSCCAYACETFHTKVNYVYEVFVNLSTVMSALSGDMRNHRDRFVPSHRTAIAAAKAQ